MTELTPAAVGHPAGSCGPVLETTVGGVLREAAERAAGTVALVEGIADRRERRRWSYAGLLADSERVAWALLGRFAPGERVAVWAPNCPEWLLLEFGAALAGLTLVTVNPALRAREVAYVLGQSQAHGVVLAPSYRPAVADVAVVGVPDEHWGEQVAAFIRPAAGNTVTAEELAACCRAQLAAHKIPRHWVFTDVFPLTASGKVQKFLLREQFTSGQAPA